LALFGAFYARRAEPDALLDRFSLRDKANAPFDTLSGGQRQRLALALAFVNEPELVFLDEPTTGLDPQSRLELHAEIARMKQDGHTVLLTTHYIDEANALCDRVAIIDHGRIIAVGAPKDLIAASQAAPTVSFTTSRPLPAASLASLAPTGVTQDGAAVRFTTTDVRRTLGDLLAIVDREGVDLTDLHVQKTTLEGVFIELTGSDLRD
jgi:ABC-2 type transport system ATP-binding protein